MNRRRSASFISFAVCLSSSIALTRFIGLPGSNLRSTPMQNQAVRIVTWNIEKGKRWTLLEQCLEHESIRTADVLCLNEVDEGMARSGNLRIADEIGGRFGMQVAFGQAFKEFTKGIDDELLA